MPRRKAKARPIIDPMEAPTIEQINTAPHTRDFVTHAETNTKSMAYRSFRDPILRWEKDRKITDIQANTIRRMQSLWQAVHGSQRLTARYAEPVSPSTDAGSERHYGLACDLRRIEAYFDGLASWYAIFERVCRFGLTGPEACATDSTDERRARDRALVIVAFVADIIATKERW